MLSSEQFGKNQLMNENIIQNIIIENRKLHFWKKGIKDFYNIQRRK